MNILIYGLLAAVVYLIYDVATHGQIFRSMFCRQHAFFYLHPKIGKFLGIRYLKSDEWSTNRVESRLALVQGFSIFKYLVGLKFKFGDRHDINVFKTRQRQFTRPLDLSAYFDQVLEKRFSVEKLEELLVQVWTDELTECYGITVPDNARYGELILKFRKLLTTLMRGFFPAFTFLVNNFSAFLELRSILQSLSTEEQLILTVPFLTTVDSSIFNFASTPDPPKEFNELFHNTPVEYVAIDNKDGQVILQVVPNRANHPGNSVFGPQGMICPGNTVTSMLMKSVADLKRRYRPEVEGSLNFLKIGSLKIVTNPKDVFVTFQERAPGEIEVVERDKDLDLTRTGDDS